MDLYFWPTPNGLKLKLFFEESGLEHRIILVNLGQGDQLKPEFLAISPNNRAAVAVLAGGRPRADGGAERPFPHLCARKAAICH
jgi:GST-like protein